MDAASLMDSRLCVGFALRLGPVLWLGAAVALLATAAAWLLRRRLGGRPKGRFRLALAAAAVIVLALAAVLVWRLSRPSLDDPSQWVGRHLRLIGVRPDGGDELLDPAGNPIGVLPDYAGRHATWSAGRMPRHFIFELRQADQPIRLVSSGVHLAGEQWKLADPGAELFQSEQGRRLAALPALLPRTYGVSRLWGLSRSDRTVTRVDLTLRYYLGPRGPADCGFSGPFQVGQTLADDAGKGYLLFTAGRLHPDDPMLEFEVRTALAYDFGVPLIVYDSAGRWHQAQPAGGSTGSRGSRLKYHVRGVSLAQVTAIAFNEKPHEETFRNVLVHYPGRSERRHAPWLDELAARLSVRPQDPADIHQYRFQSSAEAIECIELIRGPLVDRACETIRRGKLALKPDRLDEKQRQRVRAAAASWLKAPDLRIRASAIQLGLWALCGEFVAPALEMVQTDERLRSEPAYALQEYCKHLTPPQVHAIKQVLLTRDDPLTYRSLLNCLRWNRDNPARTPALWELAESDKVWLWWPALSYLSTRSAIEKSDAMPDWLRRRLVARGIVHLVPDAERIAPEAHRMLPGLLTPKFVQMDLSDFHEVLQATVKHVDRRTATSELIRFLKQLLAEWDAHVVEGRASSSWWAVDRAVRQLNHWHGVNIGGLGGDVHRESSEYAFDWQAIAMQAIRWSQTGADPAKLPAGWRPGGEDLRIVWLNKQDPELSLIGVWTRPAASADMLAWAALELADDFFNYQIIPGQPPGGRDYLLNMKLGILRRGADGLEDWLSRGELPLELPFARDAKGWTYRDKQGRLHQTSGWQGQWEVWIEPASAEKSAAGQTRLFGDWKKDYLSAPLAEPRPRIFFRHPRPAVKQYILARRSYEGWTDAEKAFCAALDQDADWLPHDLRDFSDELSREAAIQAWNGLLERKDLTVEMQVLAWWRLGWLYSAGRPQERDQRDRERSAAAFEKALSIDPELVNRQTINAASVLSSRSGPPAERAARWEQIYRWLVSRSDEVVARSAHRPSLEYSGPMRFRRWDQAPADELQHRADGLKSQLKSLREQMETSFPSILQEFHRADPAAAQRLLEKLKDIAATEKLTTWRKLLPAPAKPARPPAAARPAGNPNPATTRPSSPQAARPRSPQATRPGSPRAERDAAAGAARGGQELLERHWAALADDDLEPAHEAVVALTGRGEAAVAFLKGKLAPVAACDEAAIGRLIEQLDAPRFAARERASEALGLIGISVEEALHKAMRETKSPELQERLKKLIASAYSPVPTTAAGRRWLRAIRVLERIGTPDARTLLGKLAAGARDARATQQAASALRRLGRGEKTDSATWWLARAEEEAELWGNAYQRSSSFAEIAKVLADGGRIRAALALHRRVDHGPDLLGARYRVAAAYARAGQLKQASEFATETGTEAGAHAELKCHIGVALAEIGWVEPAVPPQSSADWIEATAGHPAYRLRPGQEWKVGEAQLSSIQACLHAAIAAAHARAGRAQDYRKHIEKAEALAKAIPGDINKMWAQMLSSVAKPDEGPGPDPTNAIYKSKAIESVVIARAQAGDHDGARRSLELIPAGRHRDARARLLVKALAEAGALEAARAAAEAITEDAVHRDLAFVSIVGAHARAGDLAGSRALAGRIRHGEYRLIAQMHLAAADRAGRGGDYAAVLRAAADSRLRPNLYRDLARIQAGAPSRREMAKWIAALGGAEARFHAFLGAGEGVMAAASKPASAPAAPARSQLGGAGPASAPAGSAELAAEETKKRMEQFARELEAPPR